MKKIGILTFHNGENYGASLQCYALQTVLKELDTDVEVINFKKNKEYNSSKNLLGKYFSKAYVARAIYAIPYHNQLSLKKKRFKDFLKNNLKLGTNYVVNENNISNYCEKYDSIIFGSDQIWNMDSRVYDKSKVFFGDFDFNGSKISYSASFGDSINIANENSSYINEKLSKFEMISVREVSGQKFLKDINILSEVTVDPTMLLNVEKWNEIAGEKPIITGDYILYYSVNCRKYSWKVAQKLAKLTGLKVINLVEHPKIIGSRFENYYSAGPTEFLNIIKNANYVVTNSFHGTIFSILFKKKFIPVFAEKDGKMEIEERKYSILKSLNLERIMKTESSEILLDDFENIYSDSLEKRLTSLVNDSIDYLKKVK